MYTYHLYTPSLAHVTCTPRLIARDNEVEHEKKENQLKTEELTRMEDDLMRRTTDVGVLKETLEEDTRRLAARTQAVEDRELSVAKQAEANALQTEGLISRENAVQEREERLHEREQAFALDMAEKEASFDTEMAKRREAFALEMTHQREAFERESNQKTEELSSERAMFDEMSDRLKQEQTEQVCIHRLDHDKHQYLK